MILDGKALARKIQQDLRGEAEQFQQSFGFRPCLATVLVGDDPASSVYVRSKRRACDRIGFESRHHELSADSSEAEVLSLVRSLNEDPGVHGILVQLPLPAGVDSKRVLETINPAKDVDGFHPVNVGALALKQPGFVSCTPKGVMRLVEESGIDPSGLRATVVGRSAIVGLPAALLLTHANATVTVVHSRTSPADREAAVRSADILVVAVGRPGFVPGEWVKEGAVVIDVGINRLPPAEGEERGRLVGDVDFPAASSRAGWITPVPGGVGPMTITMLMSNTLQAARAAAQSNTGAS
ncbi:MAG: bifunctional methylenetetrahydrofolate dehydrogenase/methenyltetrahydrofolate cyclohydrolase FolD [Myxococcota bacterium]|nr:bifunctional methylenetetrahydrofolate dehydrogenase/methenyltetrahydrofolate cyclohydrolase FolD [Myxococcota bacterium]